MPETPAPTPQEGTGGDQTSAPLPQTSGNIPENVNASPEFLALRDQLESSIVAYDADVGGIDVAIAVTDLQNGETISVGGNVLHRTGCVINLFALLGVVSQFQAGNASPDGLAYSIKKGIGGSYPPEVKNFTQSIFGSYWEGTYYARSLMSSWGMTASYFDHIPFYGDADGYAEEIEEFLTGARQAPISDRILTTVMFTDIVGSTERAAVLGDARWRELVSRHDELMRAELERHRGREVKTMGDGFLATFDGPARGIRCARATRTMCDLWTSSCAQACTPASASS